VAEVITYKMVTALPPIQCAGLTLIYFTIYRLVDDLDRL